MNLKGDTCMRNPYLKEMNTFMALHWKDTLEANGFFALRDFTEWVRVVNRNVMQIILVLDIHCQKFSFTPRLCQSTCGAIIAAR